MQGNSTGDSDLKDAEELLLNKKHMQGRSNFKHIQGRSVKNHEILCVNCSVKFLKKVLSRIRLGNIYF